MRSDQDLLLKFWAKSAPWIPVYKEIEDIIHWKHTSFLLKMILYGLRENKILVMEKLGNTRDALLWQDYIIHLPGKGTKSIMKTM